MTTTPTLRDAAQRDALLQAALDFISRLTGMTPPIEVAPPEVFAPFYEFVDRVQEITSAGAALAAPANTTGLAHEIWAAAQLTPSEGIEDGAARVEALLVANSVTEAGPADAPPAWPKDAAEVRQFMGTNCEVMQWAVDEQTPSDDDRYQLTAHDFLSAVDWWADHPHYQPEADALAEPVATVASWTNGSYSRNYKLTWHRDVPEGTKLYTAPPATQLQQAEARALEPIRQAIRDYHYALDTRQHGDLAQSSAFNEISQHLGMHWQQGKEAAIRAKGRQS